jgi:hypothetical protein
MALLSALFDALSALRTQAEMMAATRTRPMRAKAAARVFRARNAGDVGATAVERDLIDPPRE